MEAGNQYKKGLWTKEEDKILVDHIKVHGEGQWNRVAKNTGLKRCGKSCRLRWVNYLSPNVKRGHFTEEEEDLIVRLHNLLGNRWALISKRVPGRTDNQVKNYWNTHLSKKLAAKEKNCRLGINEKSSRIGKYGSKNCRAVKLSKTTVESDSSPLANADTASGTAPVQKDTPGAIEASRTQEPKFEDNYANPFWIFDDSLQIGSPSMELSDGYCFDLS